MTVAELIKELEKIDDKSLPVFIVNNRTAATYRSVQVSLGQKNPWDVGVVTLLQDGTGLVQLWIGEF